jgi:hypothetical protein
MDAETFQERLQVTKDKIAGFRTSPLDFYREVLEFVPHRGRLNQPGQGQEGWLLGATRKENLLVTGNRWGKSTSAAARAIRKCAYQIGWSPERAAIMKKKHEKYEYVNIAPTADQAGIVFHKAASMLQGPRSSWLVREVKMTPFPTIIFANGSRFQARSTAGDGRHLLGHSYDAVNWDEAALEPHFTKILDNVLRMRVADRGGVIDYTSTGQGRNAFGQYFLECREGKKDGFTWVGSSFDNPNIDKESIERAALVMTDRMRAQNIDGMIVEGGGAFFTMADIDAMEDKDLNEGAYVEYDPEDESQLAYLELREEGVRYCDRYRGHRYMHGWDLADKQDRTVGYTMDLSVTPWKVCEWERFRRKGWDYVYDRMRKRQTKYGTPKATKFDSTGVGDVVGNDIQDIGAEGFNFGGAGKKDALLANVQAALALREVTCPLILVAHNEFAFYEREDKDLETDCVMAFAVLLWFARQVPQKMCDLRII